MAAREAPIDLELKSLSSATLDPKLNKQQAADAKEESMHSIHTSAVSSFQEEIVADNITETDNNKSVDAISDPKDHLKDVQGSKSDTMQKANDSKDTSKDVDIIDNVPPHQVF